MWYVLVFLVGLVTGLTGFIGYVFIEMKLSYDPKWRNDPKWRRKLAEYKIMWYLKLRRSANKRIIQTPRSEPQFGVHPIGDLLIGPGRETTFSKSDN